MARATKTKTEEKTEESKTEQPAAGSVLAIAGSDELGDVLGDIDLGVTGLEELDKTDRQIASMVWNSSIKIDGDPILPNRFVNTVTEEVKTTVRLAILTVGKSNLYSEFNENDGKTTVHCRSYDRVTGERADGSTTPCKGCPDQKWATDDKGKPSRNCGEVFDAMGIDLDDASPTVMRFKRTSFRPFKNYLNRHFFGKRVVGGKRVDLPPFCVETTVTLEMVEKPGVSYAVPVFERGDVFSREEILYFRDSAMGAREYIDQIRSVADAADEHAGEAEATTDASFKTDDFADDGDATDGNGF